MKNPIGDIPHYLRVFQAYLGKRMYLAIALTLVAALAEGVGILMLLPLLQGLDGAVPGGAAKPAPEGVAAAMQDVLAALGLAGSTTAILIVITVFFLFKGAFTFGTFAFVAYLRGQLLRELKGRMFDCYSRMSYGYYASRDTGHFVNVINEQINRTLGSFYYLTQLSAQLVNMTVYLALAFAVAWRFGVMALAAGMVLLVLFRRLSAYVRELSRQTVVEYGHLAKLLIQAIHAFKYITATGRIDPMRDTIRASIHRLTGYERRTAVASGFTQAAREPIAVMLIMAVVVVQLVVLHQPLAPILVSILLFYRGLNATLAVQSDWQHTLEYIGSLEEVDREFRAQRQHEEHDGTETAPNLSHSIRLEDVYFSHDPKMGDVLKGITLEIPVRKSVAFVGESGAGKSTLVDMLTLMHKPRLGRVVVDGVPGDRIQLASWRRQIGYVSQETVVFDDTIANNICLWEGDVAADAMLLARVREAARQAHIATFIESLPDGYQTLVGDRGLRLSGGQRQRLFIARELFRKPNLLILDEATSALDSESERAIQESIDELRGIVTVVIVAHRLSTIRNVDHVFVFDGGRIVEEGPYRDLRDAENSKFSRLVRMQVI